MDITQPDEDDVLAHLDPLEVVEHVLTAENLAFDRTEDGDLAFAITGDWKDYELWFAWRPEADCLQLCLSLDQQVVAEQRAAAHELVAIVNQRLWLGHFEVWDDGEIIFRHAMALMAGERPTLAQAAGLAVDNGIVVDAAMRTSDPAIFAIGDCASFPAAGGRRLRLESVQNANDQAKTAAAVIAGDLAEYKAVPWFWSEQGTMRLQMVGLMPAQPATHKRPGAKADSFSLFHYDGDRLACVESANAPLDHMMARRLLESGTSAAE